MQLSLDYILENFKAVIFDMDGTLVDSMWIWEEIDQDFFRNRNMEFPDGLRSEIEGMSFTETAEYFVRRFHMAETVDEVKETWNRMALDKYRTKVPLKPGVLEFLEWLKQNGIKVGMATSNSRLLVDTFLRARDLESMFEVIATTCEVSAGKPAPDVYLMAADKLGVQTKDCLVFEDVPMGIRAGKNAGMTVCAVEDDYSAYQREEKRQLADAYIVDFCEILKETKE